MVLLHEYTHSTVAYLFGYKSNPFDIYYSDPLLFNVFEKVDYDLIFAQGKNYIVGLIGISAIITNAILFILSTILLNIKFSKKSLFVYSFLFWFSLINLAEIFSYIPIRTFSNYGDIFHFVKGFNINPWWVCFFGTIFVLIGIWLVFFKGLPKVYKVLNLKTKFTKSIYLFLSLLVFFGYYGSIVYIIYKNYKFLSISIFLIIALFIILYFKDIVKKPSKKNISS
ncbi:MAG: hypothetical protein JXA94_02325 [Parachlamydiales bacterium]|nr:hypothetical protein [Parachlamydiales bacterium]